MISDLNIARRSENRWAGPWVSEKIRRAVQMLVLLVTAGSLGAADAQVAGSPQVVNGQATFVQSGNVFSITNSPNTIINWQSFSVANGAVTRFIQQSESSAVLNRIVGQDPSKVLGILQSNGRVFLINPNGIVFGPESRVDVNALVASSLSLSNENFLSGKSVFTSEGGAGLVANQGSITAAAGGKVLLIADSVTNSGIITAPGGDVVLAAGYSVQLAEPSNPRLQVVVSAPKNAVVNLGQIVAKAGSVGIYGGLIEQRGAINANTAVKGENGQIFLKASSSVKHFAGSKTTADGSGNGIVTVESGGDISVHAGATVTASNTVVFEAGDAVTIDEGSFVSTGAEIRANQNLERTKVRKAIIVRTAQECLNDPTLLGCDQVLTLDVCMQAQTPQAMLYCMQRYPAPPSLDACIATPSLQGCSSVLPTLAACTSTPTLSGCSVVLPSLSSCIASPSLVGCSAVLPSLGACVASPSLPGCSVVLPNVSACIATPTLPGCSVVLPNLTACIATPTLPGCSVVLPNLTACIATPTLPGCAVVLPNLTACIATPTLPGCAVVLPNVSACVVTPTLPGCSVVLPNLAACIAAPTLPGCSVVLPNINSCIATPSLPGCTVVMPTLAQCTSNPTLTGCQIVLPPTQQSAEQPLSQALNNTLNIINSLASVPNPSIPVGGATLPVVVLKPPAPADTPKTADKPADKSVADPDKKDAKKDAKEVVLAKNTTTKKEEPVKKLYCN